MKASKSHLPYKSAILKTMTSKEQFKGRMARIFQPSQALCLPHGVVISEVAERWSPHFSHNIRPLSPGRQSSATTAVTQGSGVTRHPQHWVIQACPWPWNVSHSRGSTSSCSLSAEAHHFLIWGRCRWQRWLSCTAAAPLLAATFTSMCWCWCLWLSPPYF